MAKRQVVATEDNSPTLYHSGLDAHYHSLHGARQESQHVFVKAGLHQFDYLKRVHLLEVGFGSGLNALLSLAAIRESDQQIYYHGLEKFPLKEEEWRAFREGFSDKWERQKLIEFHQAPWEEKTAINERFTLHKSVIDLSTAELNPAFYHLIYFDAFAPQAQPELWTEAIFKKMFDCLEEDGLLVTYCVKGEVRRAMEAAGFEVAKIPGPPGKREISRAHKPI